MSNRDELKKEMKSDYDKALLSVEQTRSEYKNNSENLGTTHFDKEELHQAIKRGKLQFRIK